MTTEEYKAQFNEDEAVGWLAIDKPLEQLYPNQEPQHYAPNLHFIAGGTEPLDGISVYKSDKQEPHFHYVTYGFSDLYYNPEQAGKDFSKYGFELTFRLKKKSDDDNVTWACNLMQNLAKYVFKSGKWFEEYHVIPANGPIRLDYDTDIVAVAFVLDPELGEIDTPNGHVQFLQMVGLTSAEFDAFKTNPTLGETEKIINLLRDGNTLLITDLDRKTSVL
ncbi:suppressor of fused domain protein [Mucilaginibacter conchicola]|uniref:Suppressor of fused domain protein n=1 Tax=Mucilaginibacter conchicola TaxID=2303333 RepID=A0A372NYN9_9SPHI|nr:suppressor of fused domain protein [Mucilaginibacter conchicola]RFZ94779.1 suppressor of fused domain protein [Mucilaginibacter conchicola]